MKIDKSVVTKLVISGIPDLDPVIVVIDDPVANRGRVTITCFDESWSHYWGSIGTATIAEFFCNCSEDYLAGKLSTGIEHEVLDPDDIERHAKAQVCKLRKDGDIEADDARDMFDEIDQTSFDDPYGNPELMYRVYGDEWWYSLPKKTNPQYTYLCRVIKAAKNALMTELIKA